MEQWRTREEVVAGLNRMEEAHTGWRRPVAFAIGELRDGETVFTLTNVNERLLSSIALARACGHVAGTATYTLDAETMAKAVALLSPAAACTDMDHPNHRHWTELAERLDRDGGRAVAVFVQDLDDAPVDDHDRAFRAAIA
ncbi:hypothetical protein ACFW3Z_04745 [Nocardiopsis alba]|jgi:hypothetical protein|uniref:hypothetical protein n=1 Tax=Nocardiopsis alba TaxID=53437 RepID=UPI0033A357A9